MNVRTLNYKNPPPKTLIFDREPANDPYIMKVVDDDDRESFQKFLQI